MKEGKHYNDFDHVQPGKQISVAPGKEKNFILKDFTYRYKEGDEKYVVAVQINWSGMSIPTCETAVSRVRRFIRFFSKGVVDPGGNQLYHSTKRKSIVIVPELARYIFHNSTPTNEITQSDWLVCIDGFFRIYTDVDFGAAFTKKTPNRLEWLLSFTSVPLERTTRNRHGN